MAVQAMHFREHVLIHAKGELIVRIRNPEMLSTSFKARQEAGVYIPSSCRDSLKQAPSGCRSMLPSSLLLKYGASQLSIGGENCG